MPQDLVNNNKTSEKDWDSNTPFETLIEQVEQEQEFAANGAQPYSNIQTLNIVYSPTYNRVFTLMIILHQWFLRTMPTHQSSHPTILSDDQTCQ